MKLYFVSEKDKLKVLYPRIPNNPMTKYGAEDSKTKRVCVCSSVKRCLKALGKNLRNKKLFVYSVRETSNLRIKNPSKKEVPDSYITKEKWILGKTILKFEYRIQVDQSVGKGIPFSFNIKNEEYIAKLYNWEFHKLSSENK
ncbi:MAG: hypothetical protein WC888_04545 [Candidatus Izemoplasmatales bacterium]|jgi:hypothetical protein